VIGRATVAPARIQRAWDALSQVLDPEVPALSVCDLGIVRGVSEHAGILEIVLTPTYSGCPATEVITRQVLEAMEAARLGPSRVRMQRMPAWSSDWISAEGKRKLRAYGIAPPGPVGNESIVPVGSIKRRLAPSVPCPRCASEATTLLSAFGSTACKSLYRCRDCLEPFEHFKPI
jgi:ring-1,2-phenylacetyl-CoA epoxidase subunit PaaD